MIKPYPRTHKLAAWLLVCVLYALPLSAAAQTRIKPPLNLFNVKDDVQFGQQAANEYESKVSLLRDNEVTDYIERVSRRLIESLPNEYQRSNFRYAFRVTNERDVNAASLPGGYIYVNRGLIEAARTEGELTGVLAHEISHVALRHGTAQATKALIAQIGLAALAASLGDGKAATAAQVGAYVGLSLYLLKFSRNYETQADVLGAQLMARAGYDPRELARIFENLNAAGGKRNPQWMSSHPNPSNRIARIEQEASMLQVAPGYGDTAYEFDRAQARLRDRRDANARNSVLSDGMKNSQN